MDQLTPLRHAEKRAELAWLNARAKVLLAELESAKVPPKPTGDDTLVYSPTWKIGGRPHLSEDGKKAMLMAYDKAMKPADVARLFKISERAAIDWFQRWQDANKKAP